jgi:integrase
MASLEKRGRSFRVVFRLRGIKYSRTLDVQNQRAAQMALLRLEENVDRLESGALVPPPGADLLTFVLADARSSAINSGPINGQAKPRVSADQLTLADLFAEYFAKLPEGNLETCTIQAMKIHRRQLERRFGKSFLIGGLTTSNLQSYIEQRSRDAGRNGRTVSPVTIKKAIVTLRTVWNWCRQHDLITRPFPSRGLKYPKGKENPLFMTFAEVTRRVAKLSPAEAAELWECAFLTLAEIDELLCVVKTRARHPFIFPLFVFAAHTGARRSEMIRSVLSDLDFEANLITIHERKKSHDKRTTRQVPMSPLLRTTLKAWLAEHPGSDHTLCQNVKVRRSRTVRQRPLPLTTNEIHDHFRRTLDGTKWEKLHGWHLFRQSFCSNCAAKGVDQRIINAWVGHLSDDMVRRYRHLLPDQQQSAIAAVFGGTFA